MKQSDLGKIQIVIAIVVAAYVVMPDLFVGPIDDAAIAAIAGIAEAVLCIVRAVSNTSNPGPEYISNEYYSDDYFSDDFNQFNGGE